MSTSGNPFEPPSSSVGADRKTGRVKKFMLAVLASMIGGSLVIALLVALSAIPDLIDSHEGPRNASNEVEKPPGLRVVQHARVMDTDQFTVQGVIHNQGNVEWTTATIKIAVSVAGKKMGNCESMIFDSLRPGARHAFLVECTETNGTDLPEGTRYDLWVSSARKRTKATQ